MLFSTALTNQATSVRKLATEFSPLTPKQERNKKVKGKGMFLYSAVSSPLDRSKRFTLSSPGRPVHSDTVLGFSWKHSSHAAIAQRLFTHISTTVYSQVLIYTAESTEASWSERKCPNFETVTTGIGTRALSIASPAFYQLSYRAPQMYNMAQLYVLILRHCWGNTARMPRFSSYMTLTHLPWMDLYIKIGMK